MPRLDKFCVENCLGTSKSRFCVPTISHDNWERSLGKSLNKRSRICGDHFLENDIIVTWVSGEGNKYSVSRHTYFVTLEMLSKLIIML